MLATRSGRYGIFWKVIFMAAATTGCTTTQLITTDFARDPRPAGWHYVCPPEKGRDLPHTGEWKAPGDGDDRGVLSASTGYWASPAFAVQPLRYYKATYDIDARGGPYVGYVWVMFEDAKGLSLTADNCTGYDATEGWAGQSMCFRAPPRAVRAVIRFHAHQGSHMRVSRVVVEPATAAGVRSWIDELGGTLHPNGYRPAPDRLDLLPRATAELAAGGNLRVVMLGDSVMNDTANSLYEVVVEHAYPRANIDVISSVSGGGGCWLYKDAVPEWILSYEPDLLMIGGISARDDIDAIRAVVEQTRAGSHAEVMLLTGPAGKEGDPTSKAAWTEHVSVAGDGFHARLKRLAGELRCEFVDLATPWGEHVTSSGKPYAHFMRDEVHPNSRGKVMLGRFLAAHFAPKK